MGGGSRTVPAAILSSKCLIILQITGACAKRGSVYTARAISSRSVFVGTTQSGTALISLKCKGRHSYTFKRVKSHNTAIQTTSELRVKLRVTTSGMNTRGNYTSYGNKMTVRFPRGMVILAGSSCRPLAEEVAR